MSAAFFGMSRADSRSYIIAYETNREAGNWHAMR